MAMQLFEHNKTAYEAAVTMLAERGKAAIRGEKHGLRQEKQRNCRFHEVAPQKGRYSGPFLTIMKTLANVLIGFYKRFISINLSRPCIYTPTCSMYTLTAIQKHGFVKGAVMGALRILRCTPFNKGGYDPVSEN